MKRYSVRIRFNADLNDLLAAQRRGVEFEFSFTGKRSVKDLVESLGVPHVEIDVIIVNSISVDFSYIVNDSDTICVFPAHSILSVSDVIHLIPAIDATVKFVVDVHLTKLAKKLRLLGFDTDYEGSRGDDELAEISSVENRILLTRDRQLLMRRTVSRGMIIRNTDPWRQLVETVERLELKEQINPFSRCIECNGEIAGISADETVSLAGENRIPPGVYSWCREFYRCRSCRRIYWRGSHYDRLVGFINRIGRNVR